MRSASDKPSASDQTASSLQSLIKFEHDRFKESIDGLSQAELCNEAAVGNWSVKDVLAHLTAWERRLLQRVAGRPEDGAEQGTPQFNESVYQKNRDRSWQSVKRDFTQVHNRVVSLSESLSEGEVKQWWMSFRFNTYNHYKWARTNIRRWRKSRVAK
jgi:hypothetical protein